MAEGGRHLNGNANGRSDYTDGYVDDMQWPDLDWLEETPEPAPRTSRQSAPGRQQPSRQRPAQPSRQDWQQEQPARRSSQPARQGSAPQNRSQRPVQHQSQQQRPAQQQGQQQRPAQQQGQQQRPAQQRPAQQRPVQQQSQQRRPAQQRPVQQRPAQQQRPVQQRPAQARRYVEVEPEEYRSRRRRRSSVPLIILIVVLTGGILFAGIKLGGALLNYQRDRSAYDSLADEALAGLAEPNATHAPEEQADTSQSQQALSEAPFAINWDYVRSVNSDVVGWIYCADTRINYPVVQTSDNDYYLHRDFTTKQPNTVGTLFADCNATLGVNLSNYLIYGHNMKDGSMFATLQKYVDQDYYNQHPVMYYLTPSQNYRIDLIAARIVESSMDNYPGYFQDESSYANYQNLITSSSYFATHASVSTGYQLVSLSTCDYSGGFNDPRFLVQGLLVPIQ